jgi:hypothetical protein
MICEYCGGEYERISSHWNWNEDHRTSLSNHQREIVTGLLLGDGWLNRGNKNPFVGVETVSNKYLEYLDNEFGILSTGVSMYRSAEENANREKGNNFISTNNKENYSNTYRWKTRSHPDLQEFADWYSTGEKVWPEDIELTPTVLKHWYCGDGNWNNSNSNNYIRISTVNEIINVNKIDNMFVQSGLPSPSNYDGSNLEFTVDDSKKLWEYMGEPLPDFEYKWPEKYH